MRRILLTTVVVVPFLGTTTLAQETATEPTTEAPPEAQQEAAPDAQDQLEAEMAESEQIVREQAANELRVDWITGTTVMAPDGGTIGNINDLIVDGETGEMKAAILSVGGFLGIGAKQIAVPWEELEINYDANEVTTDLTREEAEAAPEYVFRDQEQPPPPAGTGTGTMPVEGTGGGATGTMGGGATGTTGGGADVGTGN